MTIIKKYKNVDGIELNYEGHKNDVHSQLLKETVREGLGILDMPDITSLRQHHQAINACKELFELNFALNE